MEKTIRKIADKPISWIVTSLFIIGLCFIYIPYSITHYSWGYSFDSEAKDIGTTISGLVSPLLAFVGVILTFAAFYVQYKANLKQNENFSLQLFETKFFDLLKMHRENVNEMSIGSKTDRRVFVILRYEFQDIFDIVKSHLPEKVNDEIRAISDISFLFLFFGVGKTTSPMVKEISAKYKVDDKIVKINSELEKKQRSKVKTEHLSKIKFGTEIYFPFNGHQSRLAHYFRHLYQTMKFIESDKLLKFEQKKYYAKVLRAQLSTHELAILFYNSLSSIGMKWKVKEWESPTDKTKKMDLITKYEILKNLPLKHFTFELEVDKYFPDISYEWTEMIAQSKSLP
jgi:hypothetical protein